MKTHADILDSFPNPPKQRHKALSEEINERVGTITQWHSRNSIPVRAWPKIVAAASRLAVEGVTFELLASLAAEDAAA